MSRCKRVSWCKQMSRSPMGLLNGHADPTPKDLPEPISLCNQMERCGVPPITHSTRKSVERSVMALCGCSMQPAPSRPVLWGDWERCQLRRHWFSLLRTQTVLLTFGSVQHVPGEVVPLPDVLTRAQRAHWRLSWEQRLARNARLPTTPSLEVTIHGLPVSLAHVFGFDVVMAA